MKLVKEWNDSGSKDKGIDLKLKNEAVYTVGDQEGVETGVLSKNGGVADFQARLQGLYDQPEEPDKERNFMLLAKAWNASSPVREIIEQRLQNEAVYTLGNEDYREGGDLIMNSGVAEVQTRLQELYRRPEKPNKERDFMLLAKTWNKSDVSGQRLKNNEVYRVERSASLVMVQNNLRDGAGKYEVGQRMEFFGKMEFKWGRS